MEVSTLVIPKIWMREKSFMKAAKVLDTQECINLNGLPTLNFVTHGRKQ